MGIFTYAFCHFLYVMNNKLSNIENQLKKRWAYKYKWLRKQNDLWDQYTNFIYKTPDWEELISATAQVVKNENLNKEEAFYYTINRWYNFWSSVAVEEIFCSLPGVIPAENSKDKLVDFSVNNISFDHKTSNFPKGFGKEFAFAKANKEQLLYWFYEEQSKQQRQHFANRLFVVVHKEGGDHWKLKAEISLLHNAISEYVANFDESQLTKLNFPNNKKALSDIIWVTQ